MRGMDQMSYVAVLSPLVLFRRLFLLALAKLSSLLLLGIFHSVLFLMGCRNPSICTPPYISPPDTPEPASDSDADPDPDPESETDEVLRARSIVFWSDVGGFTQPWVRLKCSNNRQCLAKILLRDLQFPKGQERLLGSRVTSA